MVLGSPRMIGLAAAALVVAGWLLGSTLSPPVARSQERAAAREAAARSPLPTIVPLMRLPASAPVPAPSAPARNPFTFGRNAAALDSETAGDGTAAPPVVAAEPGTGMPPDAAGIIDGWRLLGVGVTADGTVTAVIGGRGDVHLVRAGDRLAEDLTVGEVTEAGVRLQRADGSTIDLRLP